MNSPDYAWVARERCRRAGFDLCSVPPLTFDSIGRYAGLAFRPRGG
jgi:hypothetical protein